MKLLRFLNLLDKDKLSFTNIAFVIILIKMAMSPLDYTGVVALIPVMALYAHKRHETNRTQGILSKQVIEEQSEFNTSLQSKLAEIETSVIEVLSSKEEIQKLTEEAKKVISNSNLASAFKR